MTVFLFYIQFATFWGPKRINQLINNENEFINYLSSRSPSSLDRSAFSGAHTSSIFNSLAKLFLYVGIDQVKNNIEKKFADCRGLGKNARFDDSILNVCLC